MSTIGLFDPVYIMPKKTSAENVEPITWTPINSFIAIDKVKLRHVWDTYIVNSAEFLLDFSNGASYTITPQKLKDGKPEERWIFNLDPRANSAMWKIWQGISIAALIILFPIGIPVAITLYCIKDYHHTQVALAEQDANTVLNQQVEEAKGNSLTLKGNSLSLIDQLENYEGYLNKILVALVGFGIPQGKLDAHREIKECKNTISSSLKQIDRHKKEIETYINDIEKLKKTATNTNKNKKTTPSVINKKETNSTTSRTRRPPVSAINKETDPQVMIERYQKEIEKLETTISSIEVKNQLTITELQERILASLKIAIAIQVGIRIANLQEKTINLSSDNKLDRFNELKSCAEIRVDLEAIRSQLLIILEKDSEGNKLVNESKILGEEPEVSDEVVNLCDDKSLQIDFITGIINEILKSENQIVIDQASTLFGMKLNKQGKLVRIPKNGSCLFLSLVHTKELKTNTVQWEHEANKLRIKLLESLRTKLENALTFEDEGFMEDEGFILKTKIQSEMDDRNHLAGYPEEFKDKILKGGENFITSEEQGEGWKAYLDSLEKDTTFAGQIELSELPELLNANIHVYQAKLNEVHITRDERNRLHVFCPDFAEENKNDYVFSAKDRSDWVEAHQTDGKILPTYSIPEAKPYERDIHIILRKNHYDLYLPASI